MEELKTYMFTKTYFITGIDEEDAIENFQQDIEEGCFPELVNPDWWQIKEVSEKELDYYRDIP
jgi:hypothetical protein